jgi:magnesium chelatase subunit D
MTFAPRRLQAGTLGAIHPAVIASAVIDPAIDPLDLAPQTILDPGSTLVAALIAVDPVGLGGVALRASAGPLRTAWLQALRGLMPADAPFRRLPLHASDAALLGGLDLAATLRGGKAVAMPGLLAQSNGGLVVMAMAERVSAGTAAHVARVLDTHEVLLEREGLTQRQPARLGLVALDEGDSEEEQLPSILLERLAFRLQLHPQLESASPASSNADAPTWNASDIEAARARLPQVSADDATLEALCATSLALGVPSLRAPILAMRAARAAAALTGCMKVEQAHAELAAQLVLAPRATRLPAPPEGSPDQEQTPEKDLEPPADPQTSNEPPPQDTVEPDAPPSDEEILQALQDMQDMMIEAAQAAMAPGLLAALKSGQVLRSRAAVGGRSGAAQKNQRRGRPVGARRGEPRAGARLHVLDTLRAAAPWQRLREADIASREEQRPAGEKMQSAKPRRIHVRAEDFHVMRYRQNRATTTVFLVDASGSSALHRLAEAKGAVELLLAECYVRRDRVAVITFRGNAAEVLLPPTRSLARAKRSLAAMPGGGGTPLASGLLAASDLASQISRQGETPVVVVLTDGRANIARDGTPGRARATSDALAAAGELRQAGHSSLLIDTSPQPQAGAASLAQTMGATYVPLPYAGAQGLSRIVQAASGAAR